MSTPIRQRFDKSDYDKSLQALRNDVKSFFEAKVELGGMHELAKLDNCQPADYPSAAEWIVAQHQITQNTVLTAMEVGEGYRPHYITLNLPSTPERGGSADT